jgi:hypothetical protein
MRMNLICSKATLCKAVKFCEHKESHTRSLGCSITDCGEYTDALCIAVYSSLTLEQAVERAINDLGGINA